MAAAISDLRDTTSLTTPAVSSTFFSTLLHALREERHFALLEISAIPNQGSLVISFRSDISIRPMHLFGRKHDHDYYFELLFAEEWDAQSHVQQKAEVFSGSKPTRVKVRSPVARIACAEETKRMESIDKAIPGMVSKSSGESAGRPALRSE